jgi:Domain of unknown function (DUF1707)
MTISPERGVAAGSYFRMRASSADRDRAIAVLQASLVEGRLTKDEFDQRVAQVFVSRTFAELMAITAELPVGPFGRLPAHSATGTLRRTKPPAAAAAAAALVWLALTLAIAVFLVAGPFLVAGHAAG